MLRSLRSNLIGIITHPVRMRVFYDVVLTFTVSEVLLMVINGSGLVFVPWWQGPGFTLMMILCNRLFGVYTRYRVATLVTKTLVIGLAALASGVGLWWLGSPPIYVVLVTFVVFLVTAIPRWFFNLTNRPLGVIPVKLLISEDQPILVTGGGGYIGTQVVDELLKAGKKIRVLDTFYYDPQVFEAAKYKGVEIITGDVTDLFTLTKAMNNVQAVVHLAGIVGDPASSLDDQLTRQLNIVTTRMVREQVKAFGINRLVFASSCSVYGASDQKVNESSQLKPVSLYAQTKIDAEGELLADPADIFHPIILRFATVFGHSLRMRFDLVVNLFTAQAYNNGVITVKGSGQWRPFIHVKDIARAIVMVLNAPIEKVSRQIFNVGDNQLNTTIGELAQLVEKVVVIDRRGQQIKVTVDDSLDDKRNYHVSFDKIFNQLGFKAETTLEKGITEMADHFKVKDYPKPFTDKVYSNMEMTKLIQKEFHTESYRKSRFTSLDGT